MKSAYYEVIPLTIVRAGGDVLTYQHSGSLLTGAIVRIPIGKKTSLGVVTKLVNKPIFDTKEITEVINSPPVPAALIALARWMSVYYVTQLPTVLRMILPTGLATKRRLPKESTLPASRHPSDKPLTSDQSRAIADIEASKGQTAILHGVTGSGKTRIYIELTKRALKSGKSAIILVPEISLTSQIVSDFTQIFGDSVFITHSGISDSQRHQTWQAVALSQKPVVVIGPRSALFSPVSKLGLIVIDEAHENAYKQDSAPRYHALRAARVLADQHKATLVLGSATPSVSDLYVATQTKSPIAALTKPINSTDKPPTTTVVDMRGRDSFTKSYLFSNQLIDAANTALDARRQVLLFHNRRGSASLALCTSCGWHGECPSCEMPLTLHADLNILKCHVCGYEGSIPPACPECSNADILFKGFGTKRIVQEAKKLWPNARIARFDTDNSKAQQLSSRYQEVYDGAVDIIIGTQVVAKGLDLPKLDVVGVVSADTGLHLPDFTASERTFQLLYQVAGRVGRQHGGGQVIIQTYTPDHPAIALGADRNYQDYYEFEIASRRLTHYPPFAHLLQLVSSYATRAGAQKACERAMADIKATYPKLKVLGPTPAFYERRGDRYRWHVVIKSSKRAHLVEIANRYQGPRWSADLDPVNLLT